MSVLRCIAGDGLAHTSSSRCRTRASASLRPAATASAASRRSPHTAGAALANWSDRRTSRARSTPTIARTPRYLRAQVAIAPGRTRPRKRGSSRGETFETASPSGRQDAARHRPRRHCLRRRTARRAPEGEEMRAKIGAQLFQLLRRRQRLGRPAHVQRQAVRRQRDLDPLPDRRRPLAKDLDRTRAIAPADGVELTRHGNGAKIFAIHRRKSIANIRERGGVASTDGVAPLEKVGDGRCSRNR